MPYWYRLGSGASKLLLELNLPTPHHHTSPSTIIITSSFAHSATSPSFTYVSNLVPDSSLCRAAAPRLHPLQLLLPDCVRFSCCLPLASASAAAPDCVRFGCCSPIASASTAAPRLRPLQLLLARLRPLRLLLSACSPSWIPAHARTRAQHSRTFFAEFEVQ